MTYTPTRVRDIARLPNRPPDCVKTVGFKADYKKLLVNETILRTFCWKKSLVRVCYRVRCSARRRNQPRYAHKVNHALDIIPQRRQTKLRFYFLQSSHQEVSLIIPKLDGPKRMPHDLLSLLHQLPVRLHSVFHPF
jgi:hypothetical protein